LEHRLSSTSLGSSSFAGRLPKETSACGTTEDGIPYFIFDFIDGAQLDEHCAQRKLDGLERVRLVERSP